MKDLNIKPYFKHTIVDGNRRVTVAEESEGAISVTTETSHTSKTETSHTGKTRKRTNTVTDTTYFKNRRQLEQLSTAINGALSQ